MSPKLKNSPHWNMICLQNLSWLLQGFSKDLNALKVLKNLLWQRIEYSSMPLEFFFAATQKNWALTDCQVPVERFEDSLAWWWIKRAAGIIIVLLQFPLKPPKKSSSNGKSCWKKKWRKRKNGIIFVTWDQMYAGNEQRKWIFCCWSYI